MLYGAPKNPLLAQSFRLSLNPMGRHPSGEFALESALKSHSFGVRSHSETVAQVKEAFHVFLRSTMTFSSIWGWGSKFLAADLLNCSISLSDSGGWQ